MARNFRPVFDDRESSVLLELYQTANGTHTSYTLASKLNPTVKVPSPEALTAFTETRDATERLIAKGLVGSKERFPGADGIYFKSLRLTARGQKAAIQHKEEVRTREQMMATVEFLRDGDTPAWMPKGEEKK